MAEPPPPPPTAAEQRHARYQLRLSAFEVMRVIRALRRQAREARSKAAKGSRRGWEPRPGQQDHNITAAELFERTAEQLLEQLPPDRQAHMRSEAASDE